MVSIVPIRMEALACTHVARSLSIRFQKRTCELSLPYRTIIYGKRCRLPKDGVIYETKEVKFTEGESCFDILERELKNAGILIESSITPATKSVYIEGINNLYEFDCGKQSGWMYTVNGDVPNVSCSEYKIKENDEIKFQYTCNLGEDIEKK